jgi:hypothetical protein
VLLCDVSGNGIETQGAAPAPWRAPTCIRQMRKSTRAFKCVQTFPQFRTITFACSVVLSPGPLSFRSRFLRLIDTDTHETLQRALDPEADTREPYSQSHLFYLHPPSQLSVSAVSTPLAPDLGNAQIGVPHTLAPSDLTVTTSPVSTQHQRTLPDGIVCAEAQLRSLFRLTEESIGF